MVSSQERTPFNDANVTKIRLRYRPGRAALLGFVADVPAFLGLTAGIGGLTAGYAVALGAPSFTR